jgi:hypothetical protein
MKKLITFVFISLFLQQVAFSFEECLAPGGDDFNTINKLIDDVSDANDKLPSYDDALNISVTKLGKNQGSGVVKVLQDDAGNITAVQVDFKQNGKTKESMIRTIDELNNGKTLEYKEANASKAALMVKKKSGSTISPSQGGPFTFSILADKYPAKYIHYTVYLRKNGNNWITKNKNGTILKSVDLTPEVTSVTDWSWAGTFSEATFN